jgi:hypothetical protein
MTPTVTTPPDLHTKLQQEVSWYSWDDAGYLHRQPLERMTDRHRRSVITYLRDRAGELHDHHRRALQRELATGRDYAELVSALAQHGRTQPELWLDETPLMRRLRELSPDQPPGERRRRWLPARFRR